MPDIIHLLPDSIANQIAAGEVIQRPASVVKELVENAIDAGATSVHIILKDAGRTLIQIVDNGKGMSVTDARMAFERHATSKIKSADDLFSLHTKGFRGEALASIAAIAHVEMKTKRPEDETGTLLQIAGSKVEKQEIIACANGTSIAVKNIFYNVPARRKFLKSNEVERRNILSEIERIALVHPDIEFNVTENDQQTLLLPPSHLRQRIIQLEGKNINQQLIEIHTETTLIKIHGYISKPENAKKGKATQFFFANQRYIRHPYFHRAVMSAFEPLISTAENPNYFIYLEVDPSSIDVNIHPTKTEVKFENEQALWQILMVTVKEALGKFNAVPTIDFDRADAVDIPIFDASRKTEMPKVNVNPAYNPFRSAENPSLPKRQPFADWEKLYDGFEKEQELTATMPETPEKNALFASDKTPSEEYEMYPEHYQYKQRYILTSVKSGLMFIDQHRAHVRILFDKYLEQIRHRKGVSQRMLFPEIIDLSVSESSTLLSIQSDLEALGFELSDMGNHQFAIQGIPSELSNAHPPQLIHSMLEVSMDLGKDVKDAIHESLALSLAQMTAIPYGKELSSEEMMQLVNQLFGSAIPNHTPDGKIIISVIMDEDIFKKMK